VTAAQPFSRPKPWMLAGMIDKKPQSRHLSDTMNVIEINV
jgi:hypothetical protein